MTAIDPSFTTLPFRRLADAALERARDLGATHADFRFERLRHQQLSVRDAVLQGASDSDETGFAVRVIHGGAWGFAAGVLLTTDEAVRVAEEAVQVARVAATMTTSPVELAPEPVHDDVAWCSAYHLDPFTVPTASKAAVLIDWTAQLLRNDAVSHATASLQQVLENKFYADLAGTRTTQQRVRIQPSFAAMGSRDGAFDSMRSLAPPVARGWEYVTGRHEGRPLDEAWDWEGELAEVPELLAEKLAAPSVVAGTYDLVVDPSNLWLTIHESIGHATELDRALGYEANYAGTSFATYDKLGRLQYGSPAMHVTGDRVVRHGLATIGYDDEGVATQQWDIVRDGVLVGYQLDRPMAALKPELNDGRSNGCAFADSPAHVPIQRMANVSLMASPDGGSTADLIGRVEDGIYVVGDKSWSIDMQRFNFQFTGQRFYRIRDGQLDGQLRDVAYQATTTEFWNSLEAVGGPETWVLGGAFNCGKAQPGQVAAVSHGCPTSLFRGVRILNTTEEAGL
ncbi:TldD/PmbA family protein [Nocardioides cavernaquae]|uniref:TldD/PmbA family protein n=1 Tax=Nocardioides cavernaquae TaxID=2321396 RepID=A0A3A5HB04_9ACTN|nr:TldD/PmbA family protein [Nocardioides cavernaquae]RJS47251.1 TldD/PmbA family protein [Nocardioides cavernaquae]